MSTDGQRTKCRKNIAANYNHLSSVHELFRRQTDGRATAYCEGEHEFTFAKNLVKLTWLRSLRKLPVLQRLSDAYGF